MFGFIIKKKLPTFTSHRISFLSLDFIIWSDDTLLIDFIVLLSFFFKYVFNCTFSFWISVIFFYFITAKSPTPGAGSTTPPIFQPHYPAKIPPSVAPKPAQPKPVHTPAPKPVSTVNKNVPFAPKPRTPPPSQQQEGPSQGPCTDCGRLIT